MNKEQGLYSFFSSFGIPAYDETAVPDNAAFPYLTYTTVTDSIGNVVSLTCNLWYRGTSWRDATEKVNEISERLLKMPCIELDEGYIYIAKGTPFAQRMGDPSDDLIRRYYINLQAEFLTN